ncbi:MULTISPECIES: enoyl-CoA hydratase/isomerase family protein [Allobacillus]|uniref:enoyl-CoA hydratase/isomerase family protein n=1 Tax=Allobacillus sp. GCM10007490 TaxID=3317324 RepID=UPI001FE4F6B5|nr:enoyl-CoA hydratase [Allobacillus salarius]
MADLLSIKKNDGIATVVIDNPPMNVLSSKVTAELDQSFRQLREDESVKVIILTGAGDRAFMAGADINEFAEEENEQTETPDVQEVFSFIENIPKPTIALLNGYTLGGGLELALTCDIRIAEAHAQVGLPEVNLGLLPGAGGTQRLTRIIGPAKAKEIMFGGDPLSAEEASELGIVNKVVPQGEGKEAAEKFAATYAAKSVQALSRIKRLINSVSEYPLQEGLQLEKQLFNDLFATEDAREGIRAFREKRKPVFTNR